MYKNELIARQLYLYVQLSVGDYITNQRSARL